MLEPNKSLENIFENSVNLAIQKKHEYLTLEHFLFSLLDDSKFAEILTAFGTDVSTLKNDVLNYIDNELTELTKSPI